MMHSLVIWTIEDLVVGPGARLVVSASVWKPLYLGLARTVIYQKVLGEMQVQICESRFMS